MGPETRFVGAELKESYWRQAVKNLKEADADTAEQMSFIA